MPIRFRRTLKVAPGVKLNFSKSGISTTVGPKGFHFTFGKRGIRRSIGIPGTGISEVDYIKKNEPEAEKEKEKGQKERRETRLEQKNERQSRASETGAAARSRRRHEAASTSGSNELRNTFVLLGIVVFFFAGAAVLGVMPAHFLSNSIQYLTHLVQSAVH